MTVDRVFRDEWGRVLAALIGFLGDFDLAEEAAQEAFAVAAERWARDGTPESPRAWLVTAARNRAIDRIRRDRTLATKVRLLDIPEAGGDEHPAVGEPVEKTCRSRLLVALQASGHLGIGSGYALENEIAELPVRQARRQGVRRRSGVQRAGDREGGRESAKP